MPGKADGIQFQDPHHTLLVKHIMDRFVDDTTKFWQNFLRGIDSSSKGPSRKSLLDFRLLHNGRNNGGNNYCMSHAGGQLELPKCFYCLLRWDFDFEGYARPATPQELDIQTSVQQSADDLERDITQRSCMTSHRTLGIRENPAGIYKTDTHISSPKVRKWRN
jgi:hypothetical protein